MNILGINSFFEHPAVALLVEGELAFAIEDERLTRIKHGKRYSPYSSYLPYLSICSALDHAGLRAKDIHEVAYSYNRWHHLTASMKGCLMGQRLSPLREELSAFRSVVNLKKSLIRGYEIPHRYCKIWQPGDFEGARYSEWNHHLSHAASAFYCSGYRRALVVVSDGSGEQACLSVYRGEEANLTLIKQFNLPHSLGFLYSFVTKHLGFEPFSDEYKVMGLSAYGEHSFKSAFKQLVSLEANGHYRVNIRKLQNLESLLGSARSPEAPLLQTHKDIARSLQITLEESLEHVVRYYLKVSGEKNLCVAGGTFLNCVANAKLAQLDSVNEFFAQPAAHDAGTAIGAAALSWVRQGGHHQIRYSSMFLGTEWSDDATRAALEDARIPYEIASEIDDIAEQAASFLAEEKVIAFFQGRMEFGPRALGARSFLASPRSARTRERLNIIKGREQFRPLAPLVQGEAFDQYFDGYPNQYMMLAVQTHDLTRKVAPAIVHTDGTSRVQVVYQLDNPLLYKILSKFKEKTGIPILINTSLNVRGKPIDESPVDALGSAICSGVDAIIFGKVIAEFKNC